MWLPLRPGSCSLISILSQEKKSPIFAQQLEEETEEPLGSRILVGYDNAHEEKAARGGQLRDGWRDRGGERGWCTKGGDGVVVSADGWAGGLSATYSTTKNRWGLINPEREALPAQVTKQPQLSQGSGFIVN